MSKASEIKAGATFTYHGVLYTAASDAVASRFESGRFAVQVATASPFPVALSLSGDVFTGAA